MAAEDIRVAVVGSPRGPQPDQRAATVDGHRVRKQLSDGRSAMKTADCFGRTEVSHMDQYGDDRPEAKPAASDACSFPRNRLVVRSAA